MNHLLGLLELLLLDNNGRDHGGGRPRLGRLVVGDRITDRTCQVLRGPVVLYDLWRWDTADGLGVEVDVGIAVAAPYGSRGSARGRATLTLAVEAVVAVGDVGSDGSL